jgi:chondroitin AC lyase
MAVGWAGELGRYSMSCHQFRPGVYRWFILFCLLALPRLAVGQPSPQGSGNMSKAIEQFREFCVGGSSGQRITLSGTNETVADPGKAMQLAQSLDRTGSWSDLDYASSAVSEWPPAIHCSRLLAMAGAAADEKTSVSDRATLLAAVHRSLDFWATHDLLCKNWWYNQIGVPKSLATAALLMGDALAPAELHYLTTKVMPRCKIRMTGQNRVWLAGNTLMFGLLQRDDSLVAEAAHTIWDEIRVTEQEGIQPDFSFHQHGPQQQFGNYGLAFAVEECKWGQVLRGTSWAMPAAKLAIYRDYLLEGQNWVSYRGSMDISSCGRQLAPDSPRQKTRTIVTVMESAASFDEPHAADYLAFVRRNSMPNAANDLIGDRVFWRSDYLVHRRPDWCATLKMHSKRTIGTESINGENLQGYYLSDGALYLYRDGDEYRNIFPLWDWSKLPGVTCPQSLAGPPRLTAQSLKTNKAFVGGVTDGTLGCAAMDYQRDGVKAHKAWFFGDNVIFCLGAGIQSDEDAPIATTINQCLLRGGFTTMAGGKQAHLSTGMAEFNTVDWIEQDGWRYAFPSPQQVRLNAKSRTGNWRRVFQNPATPPDDLSMDVFTLWIDHGVKPQGAEYEYAILPAGHALAARVLANSAAMQAVAFDDHRLAIVFWSSGKLSIGGGGEVQADQPCTVLLDTLAGRAMVSDPTQTLPSLTLTFGGEQKRVPLPSGGDAGRSMQVSWK